MKFGSVEAFPVLVVCQDTTLAQDQALGLPAEPSEGSMNS
jgi:hypothetical protein